MGRTDAEAKAPVLWPPDAFTSLEKIQLFGKDPGAGKDWKQKEKKAAEDEVVWQHHRLSGHEPEQTTRESDGQESLAGWSPQDPKQSNTT